MGRILSAEVRKFKRSAILWVIVAVVLFPVAVSLLMAMGLEANGKKAPLLIFIANHFLFLHLLMGAPLFTLIAGYVFSREHQERTINHLLTYPYSRWQWYAGKLLVVVPIVALVLAVQFLLQWGTGALYTGEFTLEGDLDAPEDQGIMVQIIKSVLLGILFQILLIPAGAAAGILGKNVIAPVVLGISAAGLNGVIVIAGISMKYAAFNPWFLPILHSGILAEQPPDNVYLRAYVSPGRRLHRLAGGGTAPLREGGCAQRLVRRAPVGRECADCFRQRAGAHRPEVVAALRPAPVGRPVPRNFPYLSAEPAKKPSPDGGLTAFTHFSPAAMWFDSRDRWSRRRI